MVAAPAKKAAKKKSPAAKAPKANKPAKASTVTDKERAKADAIGITVRGFRILKAVHSVDARLSYTEIASKSGVITNHLNGQLWGDGEWGAGERALGHEKMKLVRRYDTPDGIRVGLTAKGAKALESVK